MDVTSSIYFEEIMIILSELDLQKAFANSSSFLLL